MVQIEIKMIGNKIAEARKKAGLSQAQLSQHLFISPQAVGKWERGESLPDIITFHKMSQILGVDLYFFLDITDIGIQSFIHNIIRITLIFLVAGYFVLIINQIKAHLH